MRGLSKNRQEVAASASVPAVHSTSARPSAPPNERRAPRTAQPFLALGSRLAQPAYALLVDLAMALVSGKWALSIELWQVDGRTVAFTGRK